MGVSISTLSLLDNEAAQWNKDLMLKFQAALQKDPAADLMSIFPLSYLEEHRNAQFAQLSYAAQVNFTDLNKLYDRFWRQPEFNMISTVSKNYTRRINMATGTKVKPTTEQDTPTAPQSSDFRTRLDLVENARLVYPLSADVTSLLARYTEKGSSDDPEQSLITPLRQLLWDSPKI
jgi:hypothetical protein